MGIHSLFGVWRNWLAHSHGVRKVARSSRVTPTRNESVAATFSMAPRSDRDETAAKLWRNSAVSRRSDKKKFETTRFAKIATSSQLFFSRAIFSHSVAVCINSRIGSIQIKPPASSLPIVSCNFIFSSKN